MFNFILCIRYTVCLQTLLWLGRILVNCCSSFLFLQYFKEVFAEDVFCQAPWTLALCVFSWTLWQKSQVDSFVDFATPSSRSLCLAYCTSAYYPELWILSLPPTKTSALCLGFAAQGSDLITLPGRKLSFMRSRLVWFSMSVIRAPHYLLLCAWKQL